jgi:hypothetical protein
VELRDQLLVSPSLLADSSVLFCFCGTED